MLVKEKFKLLSPGRELFRGPTFNAGVRESTQPADKKRVNIKNTGNTPGREIWYCHCQAKGETRDNIGQGTSITTSYNDKAVNKPRAQAENFFLLHYIFAAAS